MSALPGNSSTLKPFPWENAMGFGLGVLQLAPAQFWSMTPKELDAAYRASSFFKGSNTPIERGKFDQLMGQFPDKAMKT